MKYFLSALLLPFLYLLSVLPFWFIYLLSDLLFVILYHITAYRRQVVDENLFRSFPDYSTAEKALIRKQFYKHLADLILESTKLLTISAREVKKRVIVTNPDCIKQFFDNGQSVIGVLGHYGNWELGALRFSQLFEEKRIIVYKPLSNRFFDQLVFRLRSRFGATLVDMKNASRMILSWRKERTVTVLVGDQIPARSEGNYFTNFLNQPTAVFLGVEKLARYTNSAVVFCDIRRIKRGYYSCEFVPLFKNPQETKDYEITNKHVQYLEKIIREEPAFWLWSHRRWKYQP